VTEKTKRLKDVADGLRRLQEFESARYLDEYAEILQAHTALVARLHDVTTMLEAERARIDSAPTMIIGQDCDIDRPSWLDGQRVRLVVAE
jgi:hypothetical protein